MPKRFDASLRRAFAGTHWDPYVVFYPSVARTLGCMPETVLFESEGTQGRSEIASYLHRVAEKLDAGEDITLTAGDQSVTLTPPAQSTFEVKAEREGPTGGPGELSIEFEIEWSEDGGAGAGEGGGVLAIE